MANFRSKVTRFTSIGMVINGSAPLATTSASIILIIIGVEMVVEELLEDFDVHADNFEAIPCIRALSTPFNTFFVFTSSLPITHPASDGKHHMLAQDQRQHTDEAKFRGNWPYHQQFMQIST